MGRKNAVRLIGTPIPEGVRFELGETVSLAVRNAKRDIAVHVYPEAHFFRDFFSGVPLVRGIVRLFCSILRFLSGLHMAALLNPQTSVRGSAKTRKFAKLFQTTPQLLAEILSVVLIPIILLAGLWGLPRAVECILSLFDGIPRFAVNTVCCAFRIAGMLLSVAILARIRLLNRFSMYRGAMAKVANAYEIYGANLTDAEISRSSTLTERSDGAFLLIMLSIAMIGFALIRTASWSLALLMRLGVLLAASAVVEEILRPIENARADSFLAQVRSRLSRLQGLYTLDPHPQMIEVALCALHAATENDISDVIE